MAYFLGGLCVVSLGVLLNTALKVRSAFRAVDEEPDSIEPAEI